MHIHTQTHTHTNTLTSKQTHIHQIIFCIDKYFKLVVNINIMIWLDIVSQSWLTQ